MTRSHLLRVPASTSNLGPGFDFLGLALSLWIEARILPTAAERTEDTGLTIAAKHGEARHWPTGSAELVARGYTACCAMLGREAPDLCVEIDSEIPLARGLGSSGAALACGILLAGHALQEKPTLDEILALGLKLEGHPDNVTASLVGGCTLCVPNEGRAPLLVTQAVHPDLELALAWPKAPLSTARARKVLPQQVPFADAVENPRRLALLLEGLRNADPQLLRAGSQDRLHVEQRLDLIPGSRAALAAALDAGACMATISGSGSALIAIAKRTPGDADANDSGGPTAQIAAAMAAHLGDGAEARAAQVVCKRPRVEAVG